MSHIVENIACNTSMSSRCFTHPLIEPLPNHRGRGNHIPYLRQQHLFPGRWKLTLPLPSSAPAGFSTWMQGLRVHFQRCHWQWQKEKSYFLGTFSHFSLLYFLLCFNWSKKNEKTIPTNPCSSIPDSLCNFSSVLTVKGSGCRQARHCTGNLPELRGLLKRTDGKFIPAFQIVE